MWYRHSHVKPSKREREVERATYNEISTTTLKKEIKVGNPFVPSLFVKTNKRYVRRHCRNGFYHRLKQHKQLFLDQSQLFPGQLLNLLWSKPIWKVFVQLVHVNMRTHLQLMEIHFNATSHTNQDFCRLMKGKTVTFWVNINQVMVLTMPSIFLKSAFLKGVLKVLSRIPLPLLGQNVHLTAV